jgi:hypothetical protein
MKFTKQKISLFNYHTDKKDLLVDAECLSRVAVNKDVSDKSGKHYVVTLIKSGAGVVSTAAMHEPGSLKDAKALAIAIEEQVTANLDAAHPRLLSKDALWQLRVLVGQFQHRQPLKPFKDSSETR